MSENNYKVYVHINKTNGKRYYGITKQKVETRWNNGKRYKGNDYFTNAINKHGWNNFEHIVIAKGLTEEEAKWLEVELIRELDTTNGNKGYNITKGGDSNPMDNEESRKKISESLKGKKLTGETRKKISKSLKGRTLNEEHRKKISESLKGRTFTEETKQKMSETMKGKKLTEETRKKISKIMKGRILSEETKQKMSETMKGKNNPNATKVYCVELDMVFNTVTEASEYVGCSISSISSVLTGKRKTAKGYHWIYAEDRNNK